MRLRRADWIFAAVVLAVLILVSLLPSPREQNPAVPATAEHAGVAERQCSACHAPNATSPLPPRHPKRGDCFRCHRPSSGESGALSRSFESVVMLERRGG